MKESLLQHLVCPDCLESFELERTVVRNREIEEGHLRCRSCARGYPVVKGIPRFVETDRYAKSFSFQWNRHRRTQVDSLSGHAESAKTFALKTGLTAAELHGRLVLDVGCGTGRFMEVAAAQGAEVIGIDLAYAVEAAYANVGTRPNQHVVQADLFRLPFRLAWFEVIFSIGVLHHTPDTRRAFLALPPYLKPGGLMAIWVYEWAGDYSRALDRVRRFTVGLPHWLLYGLCCVAVPLLRPLHGIPGLRRLAQSFPVSHQGHGLAWDILDTFDTYSPRYQWKHTRLEVLGWFKEAGLEEIAVLPFPVSVRGRAPSRWSGGLSGGLTGRKDS